MSDRYEREIDELLHRLEGRMRREPLPSRMSRRFRPYSNGFRTALASFLRRAPAEQFMIAGMVLVVVSLLLNMLGMPKWAFYASMLSIVLFIGGIALSIAGRHSPGYGHSKRWRGRDIDYRPSGPTIWTQLRNWLRRRRRL